MNNNRGTYNKYIIREIGIFIKELGDQVSEIEETERIRAQHSKSLIMDVATEKTLNLLKEGRRLLNAGRFLSIDDYKSVKYLIEVETFFKTSFPDYTCFIEYEKMTTQDVLFHAQIEIKLDELERKYESLYLKNNKKESDKLHEIVLHIRKSNGDYFIDKKIDGRQYKNECLYIINKNSPFLKRNKTVYKLLVNLIALILTAGTAFVVNKAVTGDFLFFYKPNDPEMENTLRNIDNLSDKIVSHDKCSSSTS